MEFFYKLKLQYFEKRKNIEYINANLAESFWSHNTLNDE
jgi:hypothetical protein